jgi:hypothetical protein
VAEYKFSYDEMSETLKHFKAARETCFETGDFTPLINFWADDSNISYDWYMGPGRPWFYARGRKEILQYALGTETAGHRGFRYPNFKDYPVVIDPVQGIIVEFWDTVSPHQREDGTTYHVEGPSGSIFWYAGDGKWSKQTDFTDVAGYEALFKELMQKDLLDPEFKEHIEENLARKEGDDYRDRVQDMLEKQMGQWAQSE